MSKWLDLCIAQEKICESNLLERNQDRFRQLTKMVIKISKKHHEDLGIDVWDLENKKVLLLTDFLPETEKLFQKFLEELEKEGIA